MTATTDDAARGLVSRTGDRGLAIGLERGGRVLVARTGDGSGGAAPARVRLVGEPRIVQDAGAIIYRQPGDYYDVVEVGLKFAAVVEAGSAAPVRATAGFILNVQATSIKWRHSEMARRRSLEWNKPLLDTATSQKNPFLPGEQDLRPGERKAIEAGDTPGFRLKHFVTPSAKMRSFEKTTKFRIWLAIRSDDAYEYLAEWRYTLVAKINVVSDPLPRGTPIKPESHERATSFQEPVYDHELRVQDRIVAVPAAKRKKPVLSGKIANVVMNDWLHTQILPQIFWR